MQLNKNTQPDDSIEARAQSCDCTYAEACTTDCVSSSLFAPKYRRKVFYKEKRAAIGKILRQLCEWKGVKIIEAECRPDHIHTLAEILPHMSAAQYNVLARPFRCSL